MQGNKDRKNNLTKPDTVNKENNLVMKSNTEEAFMDIPRINFDNLSFKDLKEVPENIDSFENLSNLIFKEKELLEIKDPNDSCFSFNNSLIHSKSDDNCKQSFFKRKDFLEIPFNDALFKESIIYSPLTNPKSKNQHSLPQNYFNYDLELHEKEEKRIKSFKEIPNTINIISLQNNLKQDPEKNIQQREKRIRSSLKNFHNLNHLLVKLFTCEEIQEEDLSLKESEFKILNFVVHKKFTRRIDINFSNPKVDDLKSTINNLLISITHKKNDQNRRFVLGRAIKNLKKRYKNESKVKKEELEESFYNHYFKETAESEEISIKDFYYTIGVNKKRKTIDDSYFEKIFKSERFLKELIEYIKSEFNLECKKEIKDKIEKMLKKWDDKYTDEEFFCKEYMKRVKQYFLDNTKCKLPWSVNEIKVAVYQIYDLMEKYGNKNLLSDIEKLGLHLN